MAESSPLVRGAVHAVQERIRSGEFPVGRGLPSERQLSEQLFVSRVVVRAAIQELERQGLVACKARCRPIVRTPHLPKATHLETQTRYIAVWLWPSAGDFCAATILRGIQRAGLPPNIKLVIGNAVGNDFDKRLDSEAEFLRGLATDPDVAGVLIWYLGGEENESSLQMAMATGVPVVFLDRLPPASIRADFVGTDNEGAARRATEHLISLGHRRIALLSNIDKASSVRARESGYLRALRDAGIEVQSDLIFQVQTDEIESVADAIDRMLKLPDLPTAVFGINDHIALQAHKALTTLGVDIPTEMSVLGFDGLLRWVPGGGYLTSAWQEFDRIGQTAGELILERLNSPHDQSFRHILFDAPVRPRASTGRVMPTQQLTPNQPRDFTEEVLS